MYEYKFVETSLGGLFSEDTHQQTIEHYANEGWRLVQLVPVNFNSYGKPTKHELIFERPK